MLIKTHLMFAIAGIILFFNLINDKFIFVGAVLIASFLPDIDSGFSTIGKRAIAKPIQLITKHRGFAHSLSFAIFVSIIIGIYFPVFSFGFFLGFGLHVIADSFTKEGVQAFWPLKFVSSGFIRTGGKLEESIFLSMIFINIFLVFLVFVV